MKWYSTRRFFLFILLVLFAGGSLVSQVFAADFIATEEVSLESPTEGDTYVAGNQVSVDAQIGGDLLAAGQEVFITDDVLGDLMVGGALLHLLSDVHDDIRAVGGMIEVAGTVGGDVVIFGGSIEIQSSSVIEGDVYIFADQVSVDGLISGKLTINASDVTLSGNIGGDATISAKSNLTVMPSASLGGDLNYQSSKEVEVPEGAVLKGELVQESNIPGGQLSFSGVFAGVLNSLGIWRPAQFFALLIATLLIYWLFPRFSEDVGARAIEKYWQSPLYGLLFIIGGALLLLLLALTIVGLLSAWVLSLLYFLVLVLGTLFRPFILAELFATWRSATSPSVGIVVSGVVAIALIGLVPVLGPILNTILWLMAIGSLVELLYYKFKEGQ